jgi:hypothetical protein
MLVADLTRQVEFTRLIVVRQLAKVVGSCAGSMLGMDMDQ